MSLPALQTMDDPLVVVTVRIPRSLVDRAKQLSGQQDRSVQAIYARALRAGLDLEEERHRIACEAIIEAEERGRRRQGEEER